MEDGIKGGFLKLRLVFYKVYTGIGLKLVYTTDRSFLFTIMDYSDDLPKLLIHFFHFYYQI